MGTPLNLNLTNYRDKTGGRVPEGRYLATLDWHDLGTSSSGKTMLTVGFRISGGEYDGVTVVDRYVQTDAAMFRTVALLQGLGIPTPRKQFNVDLDRLVGRKLWLDLQDGEPYRGTVKSEVRGWERYSQSDSESAQQDELDLDGMEQFEPKAEPAKPVKEEAPAKDGGLKSTEVTKDDEDEEIDLDEIDL